MQVEEDITLFDFHDKKLKRSDKLLRIFEDIHDHIYANDGLSTHEVFMEVIKLLFMKVFDEKAKTSSTFHISSDEFDALSHGKPQKEFKNRMQILMRDTFKNFPDVLDADDEIKIKESTLAYVVNKLQDINLSESSRDIKGLAFQKFLLSSQRADRGQFFTPEQVVKLCVEIIKPTKDEKILDPACGSGGFLSQAMNFVFQNSLGESTEKEKRRYVENNIFGIEISKMIAKVAKMRLILEGDGLSNLANLDSLSNWENISFQKGRLKGERLQEYFDVILTNPPFGSQGKITNKSILKEYALGYKWDELNGKYVKSNEFLNGQVSDILFIERNLDFLKPGGRMAIVLPDGLFENSSLAYVRDYILERANILAIIKLPFDTFIPFGTGVKVSLLFLQKKKHELDKQNAYVFFGNVEKIGYKGNKNGSIVYKFDSRGKKLLTSNGEPIVDEDITYLIEKYHDLLKKQKVFSEQNCFTLQHSEINRRFDFDFYKPSFRLLEEDLTKRGAKRLGDLVEVVKERSEKLRLKDAKVQYVELADINVDYSEISNSTEMSVHELPSRASYQLKTGDVITATAGNAIGTKGHMSALVSEKYNGAICTNGFRILRPKNGLSVFYLLSYLRNNLFLQQVYKLRTGAAIPSISDGDLLNVLVYIPSQNVYEEIVRRMEKSFMIREESRKLFEQIQLMIK